MRQNFLPEATFRKAMPASMPTRVVAVSCELSLAEMSAALPLLAKCCVRAARVAPPATPELYARATVPYGAV